MALHFQRLTYKSPSRSRSTSSSTPTAATQYHIPQIGLQLTSSSRWGGRNRGRREGTLSGRVRYEDPVGDKKHRFVYVIVRYRVILVVSELGCVDSDLRCSPGLWAATVATYCSSRMVEHLKMKSTQPNCKTTRITL